MLERTRARKRSTDLEENEGRQSAMLDVRSLCSRPGLSKLKHGDHRDKAESDRVLERRLDQVPVEAVFERVEDLMVLIENGFVLVVLQMEPFDVGVDQNQGEGQFDDVLKRTNGSVIHACKIEWHGVRCT